MATNHFSVSEVDVEGATLVAEYVDQKGRRYNQQREFYRTPAKVFNFWDDDDVVILDLSGGPHSARTPQLPDKGTVFEVNYAGREYVLDFSASSAKDRHLPMVAADKRIAGKFMQSAEQSVYGQRFFLTSARRAVRGSFTVGLRPEGYTLPNGDIVADGMGYISRSMWEALIGKAPIHMTALDNRPRDSYQLYRMSWSAIRDEALPLLQQSMSTLLESTSDFFRSTLAGDEEKFTLLGMEPEMEQHPLCVNAFTKRARLALASKAYSVPFAESYYKLAMPVAMPAAAGPIAFSAGKWTLGRYPFSSNAALRAYEVGTEAEEVYQKQVAHRKGIQYSLSALTDADSVQFGAKGMMLVVPDEVLPDCDILICNKDVKIGAIGGKPNKKGVAKKSKISVRDGYLGAIQIYDEGAFFGITVDEWLGFPGDFDGDGGVLYECSEFPSFWQAVADLPRSPVFKIFNSETPYTQRAVSVKAWQVMNGHIGQLSNLMSTTFAVENRDWLAHEMGFSNAAAMDDRLAYLMQVEVDRYKKDIASALKRDMSFLRINDPDRAMARIVQVMEHNLVSAVSRLAPWTGWKRKEDVFRFFVPQVWNKDLRGQLEEEAIPSFWDGAVAEILKFTLPIMNEKLQLVATIRPLGYYCSWAQATSPDLEAQAKKIVERFARELVSVNETDPGGVDEFKEEWRGNMQQWEEATSFKPAVLCAALWRAAHSTSSQYSSAVAPFWCYPDETRRIVEEKPGLAPVRKAKVIGLARRLPDNGGPNNLKGIEVDIEDIALKEKIGREDRSRLARIIRASGDNLPLNPNGISGARGYPPDYLGEIPYDGVTYPATGKYIADFRRVSKGAWVMELVKEL